MLNFKMIFLTSQGWNDLHTGGVCTALQTKTMALETSRNEVNGDIFDFFLTISDYLASVIGRPFQN